MTTLNDRGAEHARGAGAHALTDVTGFGLLGHLHELAEASGLAAEVDAAAVPAIDGVLDLLAGEEALAGGSKRNRADAEGFTSWADGVPEPRRRLLCDAMTSGGLLAAIPRGHGDGGRGDRPARRRRAGDDPRASSAAGMRARKRPSRIPTTPPPRPASECGSTAASGSSTSTTAIARTPSRSASSSSPRRRASTSRIVQAASRPSAAELAPIVPLSGSTTSTSAEPATPPTKNTSSGAQAPWRRSSSQPKRKTAPSTAIS